MEPKQKQYPVVAVTGDRSKVRCCKEQYCIGTWNVSGAGRGAERAWARSPPPGEVTMRTLRRLKFMSSPSLSDLGKREPAAATAADERGTQQRRACANATWDR